MPATTSRAPATGLVRERRDVTTPPIPPTVLDLAQLAIWLLFVGWLIKTVLGFLASRR
jgi:hypothetical protein